MAPADYLLIIDLECTCYPRGAVPSGFFPEIIEVGAVLLEVATRAVAWDFNRIVKPRCDSHLSSFCTELTTLTQQQVDQGMDLAPALQQLMQAVADRSYLFSSWGFFDRKQIQSSCERYALPYPFTEHISLKHEFAAYHRHAPLGMAGALRKLGLHLTGTHHRGLDDARNIASIAARMLELGWSPQFVGPMDWKRA